MPKSACYTWKATIEIKVAPCWVADGFDLTEDRLNRMLEEMIQNELGFAAPGEISATGSITQAPNPDAMERAGVLTNGILHCLGLPEPVIRSVCPVCPLRFPRRGAGVIAFDQNSCRGDHYEKQLREWLAHGVSPDTPAFSGPFATCRLSDQVPIHYGTDPEPVAYVQIAFPEGEEPTAFYIAKIDPETREDLVASGTIPPHHIWETSVICGLPEDFDYERVRSSSEWRLITRSDEVDFDALSSAESHITAVRERWD